MTFSSFTFYSVTCLTSCFFGLSFGTLISTLTAASAVAASLFYARLAEPVDAYRFYCDDYLSYLTTAGSCLRGFDYEERGSSLTDLAYFVFDVFRAGLL